MKSPIKISRLIIESPSQALSPPRSPASPDSNNSQGSGLGSRHGSGQGSNLALNQGSGKGKGRQGSTKSKHSSINCM
jgi:hypothetical protein